MSLVFVLLLTFALLMTPTPAPAHDYLVSSRPDADAELSSPPDEVSLEFNTSIGERFAQVAVVAADGQTYHVGDPVVDGPTVTQAVADLPPTGEVTISYRVVSSDGHPIGGTVGFTVAAAEAEADLDAEAGADSDTADPVSTTSTSSSSSSSGGVSPLVWLALAGAALLAAGGFAVARRPGKDPTTSR